MKKTQQKISTPLLHRLIDEHPGSLNDINPSAFMDVEALQRDIKQNLESILNTRLALFKTDDLPAEAKQSMLTYGIADFTQPQFNLQRQQQLLCAQIQQAITDFEPRLQRVRVRTFDNSNGSARQLHLRIAGELNLKPNPKAAIFETSLDIVSHTFDIQEELT